MPSLINYIMVTCFIQGLVSSTHLPHNYYHIKNSREESAKAKLGGSDPNADKNPSLYPIQSKTNFHGSSLG